MGAEPSSLEKAFFAEADARGFVGAAVSPKQLDMLRGDDGRLPADVFQRIRDAEEEQARGPGRPAGSRNKRSDDFARYYLNRFPHPVMAIGDMANTPLDQLCELVLIAEGTGEREERLLSLIDRAEEMIEDTRKIIGRLLHDDKGSPINGEKVLKLVTEVNTMLERVFDVAKSLKMKPGDLGIKALNLKLAAQRAAAEYVESKKPVEIQADVKLDGTLVMARPAAAGGYDDRAAMLKAAADGIAEMLANGQIEPEMLTGYRLGHDGQLVQDGEFSEVAGDE